MKTPARSVRERTLYLGIALLAALLVVPPALAHDRHDDWDDDWDDDLARPLVVSVVVPVVVCRSGRRRWNSQTKTGPKTRTTISPAPSLSSPACGIVILVGRSQGRAAVTLAPGRCTISPENVGNPRRGLRVL